MATYDPLTGRVIPADLEKNAADAAASAKQTSKSSYTKTIRMPIIRNKQYKFFFTYKHQNPDTQEIKESDKSPVWIESFAIPNLTKGVQNLTLTQGYKSYGVKFEIDPTSVQEDIVIFESLNSTSIGNVVYIGTSTNVTIPTSSIATRWITVRTRDKWEDLNVTDVGPLPVTPLNPDPDTSTPPAAPTGVTVAGSIDPDDKSGFSAQIDVNWTASTDTNTAGYVIRWSTQNPATVTNPVWEYGQVDGKTTTKFTVTGLVPNTVYYYQVTAKSPYNAISWASPAAGTFGPIVDANAPTDAFAQLRSILSIGGKTADLFKIGTGIAQTINTSTTITPVQTSGNYSGIILNKSTTNVGHNYWLNTGQFRVGSATSFLYWDGSDIYTTGKINATGGSFTGDVKLDGGTLFAGAAANTGQRVRLNSSGIFAYSAASTGSNNQTFSLDTAGYMNATSGLIGGWTLGATTLSANNVILNSAGTISVGSTPSTSVYLSSTDDKRIWAGSQSSSSATFSVDQNGVLRATGAIIGLGAGSTISGYATTGSLANYTLTEVTTGINSRLTNVEGDYVKVSTLNTGLASKSTVFVTDTNDAPTPNKIGDLWINGGDNNEIYTAINTTSTPISARWSKKTNTAYATTTALNSKLSAGDYVVANSTGNITEINTNGVTVHSGVKTNDGTTTAANSGVSFNSEGIRGWYAGVPTFSVLKDGTASFAGQLSAATGTFGGVLVAGADNDSTGYINTGASRTVGTYGTVKYVKIRALGLESTSNSGFVSSVYPWQDNSASLGTNSYSWSAVYIGSNAYFANGTTYKVGSTGDAFLNGYGVSGGYGVTSDWSPRSDNTYSLGLSTKRWLDVWAVDTSVNSSDVRLKKDIITSELGLDFIKLLRPVSYKWKKAGVQEVLEDKEIEHLDKQGNVDLVEIEKVPKVLGIDDQGKDIIETTSREGLRDHYGFIAQEVKEALDTAGVGDKFAGWVLDDHNDPDSRQNLRYSEFISPLVKAVQELSNMVESLQQEVNVLKGI